MPLPVPNLDDRRFDDLVEEARARVAAHVPELGQASPGDPLNALIDLFAWITETVNYRANLIPERQRRIILNLLQIPLRPARPARGLVCVDASPTSIALPPRLRDGAQFTAGTVALTAVGELQPLPLMLKVMIKQRLDPAMLADMGITEAVLRDQYPQQTGQLSAYRPRSLQAGTEALSLKDSLDGCYYLALCVPRQLQGSLPLLRQRLAGETLNMGVAPMDDTVTTDVIGPLPVTQAGHGLSWSVISRDASGGIHDLPLEVASDSSHGGRRCGVVRLRLPRNPDSLVNFPVSDPMFAGVGDLPPELDGDTEATQVAFWLRLSCSEQTDLPLAYLDVNAVDVVAQGRRTDLVVGVGNGEPSQALALPDRNIDAASLELEIEDENGWVAWQAVDMLAGHDADARIFRLDAEAGHIFFGDGLNAGRRPAAGRRIRARAYRHGGGQAGNLSAGSVREIVDGSARHRLRQPWPLAGGVDAESVEQAEQRIPQFLTHRNRAVTREDFRQLVLFNPVCAVGRVEVLPGFTPGDRIEAHRFGVPGAVSLFVMPPAEPALAAAPRPSRRMLKDVFDYLVPRVLIGTELYVLSPEFIPLAVSLRVQVRDPLTERETLDAVRQAVISYCWALAPGGDDGKGWPMGVEVQLNPLLVQVSRVPGVQAVNAASLFRKGKSGWHALSPGERITLTAYQLPELVGVGVERGSATTQPGLPAGLEDERSPAAGGRAVPVPVIPDLC